MTAEELIARLEGAIEGSRELDANISAHIGQQAGAYYVTDAERSADESAGEWLILTRSDERHVTTRRPPAYTHSVDAALTLVPLGLGWDLTFQRDDHVYVASIGAVPNTRTGRFDRDQGRAKTAAIALCAGALRARIRTDGN
jgi:hypothetical protein